MALPPSWRFDTEGLWDYASHAFNAGVEQKREKMANVKSLRILFSGTVLVAFCLTVLVHAQMTPIFRFKGTQIPLNVMIDGKVWPKGAYDVEFLRTSSPVLYHMKFMKKGKALGVVQGEEWPYAGGRVSDVAHDRTIPNNPILKMSINRDEKLLTFVFESGRFNVHYPMIRARFKLSYVD
jgi:hypothetical protein